MKNIIPKLVIILVALVFVLSCSKDNTNTLTAPTNPLSEVKKTDPGDDGNGITERKLYIRITGSDWTNPATGFVSSKRGVEEIEIDVSPGTNNDTGFDTVWNDTPFRLSPDGCTVHNYWDFAARLSEIFTNSPYPCNLPIVYEFPLPASHIDGIVITLSAWGKVELSSDNFQASIIQVPANLIPDYWDQTRMSDPIDVASGLGLDVNSF